MTAESANRWGDFARYHLPMLGFCAVILGVSSIPDLAAPQIKFLAVDKLAHFLQYAVLAFLTQRSFSHWSPGLKIRTAVLCSFMFVAVFASLDELYQNLIPGRFADLYDLAVDLGGAWLVLAVRWHFSAKKSSR